MNFKRVLCALALSLLVACPAAQAATLDMNFQSLYNPAQRQNADALKPWADSFAEKSNGDLVMHFFYAGGVVDPFGVFEALKNGMLDAAGWSPMDIKQVPYAYMFQLPYLAKDQPHGYRLLNRMVEEIPELKSDLNAPGVLLSMAASAPVMIASKDTPVHSPADLKGKRVLVSAGAFAEYVEAWGGIPVTVAMNDVYVGLQRGMGEMFICGVSCVKGARVQEFCKYSTVTGQTFTAPFPYSINRDLFEQDMTPEQQQLTMELSKDLGLNVINSFVRDVEDTYKEFEAAGMEVYFPTEEEMNQFVTDAKKLTDSLWVRRLTEAGVKDPAVWIKRYYDIAASVE
ncbi:MAG: TRAP transporter substrate-binding protein DctP [Desulfovibrionaceae bacterium]|nr:TRAP transporter substrate-binding protein DctP [Desulfovibrionaceae bacterium]